jgi:purine nucleosidase
MGLLQTRRPPPRVTAGALTSLLRALASAFALASALTLAAGSPLTLGAASPLALAPAPARAQSADPRAQSAAPRTSFASATIQSAPAAAPAAAAHDKIILDTDIGSDIDDAWALGFAVKSPRFELLGVTVTDGNTPARAKLACKLLHRVGRTDVPVAVGRETPVPGDTVDYQFAWAEDFVAYRPIEKAAADFIAETVKQHPGEVTIVAVGPLQNVADALRKEPALPRLVKRLVLMSGSIYASAWAPGPVPEWNVKSAIADAQLVYSAGFPLTIVPLDSTTYVQLQDGERQQLRDSRAPLPLALEGLYRLWIESPAARMTLHDQLAIAETEQPGAFFARRDTLPIVVDAEGYTRVDGEHGKSVTVCLQPRRDPFVRHYISRLIGAEGSR